MENMRENPDLFRDEVLTARMAELYKRLGEIQDRTKQLEEINSRSVETLDETPAMINFADNSDFLFNDDEYSGNTRTYTEDRDKVLAEWYVRPQVESKSYVETVDATLSDEAITLSSHVGLPTSGNPSVGAVWDETTGAILLTGGYRIAHRLTSRYAQAGNYLVCRMELTEAVGKGVDDNSIKAKVSIWDNTDSRIIRGDKPVLSTTYSGTAGAVDRNYIAEYQLPSGKRYYSETVTFTSGQNKVVNTTAGEDVTVTFGNPIGNSRVNVYVQDSTSSQWYLVGTVTNGSGIIVDSGERAVEWSIPAFDDENLEYNLAVAYFDNIGSLVNGSRTVYELVLAIRVPSGFVVNGDQFLQIEFVKEDYSDTTTAEIGADGLIIDKVGLSYSNGRWVQSPKDEILNPTGITPTDPIDTGGGDGINPTDGGGYCIYREMLVWVWSDDENHRWLPAHSIVRGDRLVSWDGEKYAPSKVRKVIKGYSTLNYNIESDDNSLLCSFTHRLIKDIDDFEKGTRAGDLDNLTLVAGSSPHQKEIAIEQLDLKMDVITFQLEKGKENYVAGTKPTTGFFNHNLKESPVLV